MKPYISIVSPKFLDFLGRFSPLSVGGISNITLAPFIISRHPMGPKSETHEVIHIYQHYEVGVLGGLLLAPLLILLGVPWWGALIAFLVGLLPFVGWFGFLYGVTYLYWRLAVRRPQDGFDNLTPDQKAYFLIPFEREAYLFDQEGGYLKSRKLFAWLRIKTAEDAKDGAELPEKLFDTYENNHFFFTVGTKVKMVLGEVKEALDVLVEKIKEVDPEDALEDIQAFIEKHELEDEIDAVKAYLEEKLGIKLPDLSL